MAARHLIRGLLLASGGAALWMAYGQSAQAASVVRYQPVTPQPVPQERNGLLSLLASGLGLADRAGLFERIGVQEEFGDYGGPQIIDAVAPSSGGFLDRFTAVFETVTSPAQAFAPSADLDTVARTIWGEARGEGRSGMEAVASVIMNRVYDRRWPSSPAAVATQAYQFSAWNRGDPNRELMLAVDDSDSRFREARSIASRAIAGTLYDRTGGATHYHGNYIETPDWAYGASVSYRAGQHVFYTGVA